MYFDWRTWSIWLIGFLILITWIFVPINEFKKLLKVRKAATQKTGDPK